MEKFKLTPLPGLMWTVEDKERGIKVSFREGLFNETQNVEMKDVKKDVMTVAGAMREIGEWLALEHREIAECNMKARARALMGFDEQQLLAVTAALNSVIVDWDLNTAKTFLLAEVEDYLKDDTFGLSMENRADLLDWLALLDGEEALEIALTIKAYWDYKSETLDVCDWARDALQFPSWALSTIRKQKRGGKA